MMKKNYIYILVAVVLLVVAAVYYFNDKSGTLTVDRKAFSISDTAAVTSITIQNNGNDLLFERTGNSWLINGKYKVKQLAIHALLNSLMNFEVTAPISKNIRSRVLDNMQKHPLILTIRSSDKILKKYNIADDEELLNGSYMKLDGQDNPFAVHMAGYEGRLTVFFTTNSFIWRDRVAFSYSSGEILAVEVIYPNQNNSSFIMNTSSGDHLQVKSTITNEVKPISHEVARNFLMNFSMIPFDWIFSARIHAIADSIAQTQPFCEIRVTDSENRINSLRIYRIPDALRHGAFNPDKLYAVQQHDSIPLQMKYVDLDPVLKTFEDFKKQ